MLFYVQKISFKLEHTEVALLKKTIIDNDFLRNYIVY